MSGNQTSGGVMIRPFEEWQKPFYQKKWGYAHHAIFKDWEEDRNRIKADLHRTEAECKSLEEDNKKLNELLLKYVHELREWRKDIPKWKEKDANNYMEKIDRLTAINKTLLDACETAVAYLDTIYDETSPEQAGTYDILVSAIEQTKEDIK
jgi:hypothetical protein